jgi:hypothetical protein
MIPFHLVFSSLSFPTLLFRPTYCVRNAHVGYGDRLSLSRWCKMRRSSCCAAIVRIGVRDNFKGGAILKLDESDWDCPSVKWT